MTRLYERPQIQFSSSADKRGMRVVVVGGHGLRLRHTWMSVVVMWISVGVG